MFVVVRILLLLITKNFPLDDKNILVYTGGVPKILDFILIIQLLVYFCPIICCCIFCLLFAFFAAQDGVV